MTNIYDLIILGAGPVGLYSASLSGYYGMKTLVIESSHDYGGQPAKLYANKDIHDFPTYQRITGQDLVDKLYDCGTQYKELISWKYNTLIEKYYFDNENNVHLVDTNGDEYCTKKVLLTIGKGSFEFVKPNLKGFENNQKVVYCLNHLTNLTNINNVLVLGGGDGAVDIAIHLSQLNMNVSLIHRKNEIRAKGDALERLNKNDINVFLNYELIELSETHLHISNNDSQEIIKVPYDLIVVQYGVCPLNMPHHSWDGFETINKRYIVDRYFKTNVTNFYAVGSCITYENRFDLIITGIGEASIAINDIYSCLYPNKKGW